MQEILVEGRSRNTESDLTGRTGSWKIVNFKGEPDLIGKMMDVKISKAYIHSLRGKTENQKEAVCVN